ncbi:beta-propeller fold lactonase family protein [Negadavirga shengliensis]|uniref:Beta-propeller fold lactonase family protein n=1 Tax=Negadavirga shengliensis TaxID=1389218 RepID=A0ABV9T325_9BACT
MNKFLAVMAGLLLLACGSPEQKEEQTQNSMTTDYQFLLGTYNEENRKGIHLVNFAPDQEKLEILATAPEPDNPSFVIMNKTQNLVFSVEETGGEQGGKVSSFALKEGRFGKINSVSSQGEHPCYVSMDPSEKFLVAGNYSSGNFAVIPVSREGRLSDAVQTIQHQGSSVNPNRQKQPHVHAAIFHPQDHRLLIADLGTDEVVVYDFDSQNDKPVAEEPFYRLKVSPGAGPRHLVFNSKGDRLYLVHEITAEIGVYGYLDGKLEHIATHSLLQDGFEGKVGAAEIRITEDDRFVYVSNRGEANEIIVFQAQNDGGLTHIQTIPSGGEAPRNFNLTPDGKYLLAGNQNSSKLVVFEKDDDTGKLTPTDMTLNVNKPVYINFLN